MFSKLFKLFPGLSDSTRHWNFIKIAVPSALIYLLVNGMFINPSEGGWGFGMFILALLVPHFVLKYLRWTLPEDFKRDFDTVFLFGIFYIVIAVVNIGILLVKFDDTGYLIKYFHETYSHWLNS